MNSQPAQLDRIFHGLADPTRLGMIDRLCRGPASVKELAAPLTMALPSVMKHLRVLESSGIVVSQKKGRVRTYSIEPRALAGIEKWIDQRKAAWNRQFDRLDAYLARESQQESEQ